MTPTASPSGSEHLNTARKILAALRALGAVTLIGASAQAALFTNSASSDAFVRAAAPTLNYGGAGALSVSGSNSVNGTGVNNGVFDSFLRFNTAAMVAYFNSTFGSTNWGIASAKLRVTELGTPANTLFNRGKGLFEIRWISNDGWIEGTGTPNAPAATGITYNDEPALLDPAREVSLGTFTNAALDTNLTFTLALPPDFINDLRAGGETGLFLTTTDPSLGFTVDSRSFSTASARPVLEVSALLRPGIAGITTSGTDLTLTVTNGVAGGIYYATTSTNLALPEPEWTTIAINVLTENSNFTMTLTNQLIGASPSLHFFRLQVR